MKLRNKKPKDAYQFKGLILVVDDIPENRYIMQSILEGEGYQVLLAQDGKTAIKILEKRRPDIVLLDIIMPNLNGLEICRMIKENETMNRIPIVFVSALSSTEDKIKGLQAGAIDYVVKPFDFGEFLLRLQVHFNWIDQIKTLENQIGKIRR